MYEPQEQTRIPGLGLLAAIASLILALVVVLFVAHLMPPWLRALLALVLGAGALSLCALLVRRLRDGAGELLQGVRKLATGRVETRLPRDLPALYGQLAEPLNRIAQQLAEDRNRLEARITDASARLRQERDQLDAQLRQLRASAGQAQDEARAQSELLSSLSHELRTPLTAILGYADLLRRSGLNPEQGQQLDTLDKSARTLLAMINDLLDWSRIEAGRLRLHEEGFDLHDCVEDTVALLAPLAYDKDLELVRIIYHDVPRQLRGDPQRLRQILTNLLSNAIKFTEAGEVVVRVMHERDEGGRSWLRFAVTDTGVGIAPDQQARLFQPFRQVGRAGSGSGLGLSITRKLCELMGGEISLQSAPGQGSTFGVLLPFKLIAEAESAPTSDARLAERRVWLQESHAMARLALVHWLEFWGLRVQPFTAAGVLAGALRNASPASRPDAVILGLKPRELVDADVLAALSACKGGSPPLLALVASAALPVHEAVRQAGAAACLPKSVGRQRLHEELLRLLTENAAGAEPPLQGRRAVIADNNRPNRAYIATLCRHLGLSIREADDGAEALALWRQHKPEIVLLDARMPVMDGPSCARAIRAEEQAAGVNGQASRILAVSAYLEIEERREFLDAGADEILLKPFDETQLLRALAPLAGAPPARQAARLAADPELLELLREELPQQFADLEKTMGTGDLPAARDAAHTLRGTAAFYHLARLRQTTAALEDGLKGMEKLAPGGLPRDLENVRRAVQETLDAL